MMLVGSPLTARRATEIGQNPSDLLLEMAIYERNIDLLIAPPTCKLQRELLVLSGTVASTSRWLRSL